MFSFKLTHSSKSARAGVVGTPHGEFETPAFMPVGTQATVKTLSSEDVAQTGSQILLSNTYHLYLRPGCDLVEKFGGLHKFMNWQKPILTDSGGFQVFSLRDFAKITDDGVEFQSHLDGTRHFMTPELAIEVQEKLGADIIMCFDEPPPYPSTTDHLKKALERTSKWEERCKTAKSNPKQALFGITQGGTDETLREESTRQIVDIGFDGYAIGGLSVGESTSLMMEMTELSNGLLPSDKPRYLMGVGRPEDIIEAVRRGVDMLDCVIPTRNARNGTLYSFSGKINIKNRQYIEDNRPIEEDCPCIACRGYSRGYLRHLLISGEILALRLNTIHNLTFYQRLMEKIRGAIQEDRFALFADEFMEAYKS